ncbi:MAG TPA: MCE family protein [Pseudonocardiaceae bacterium]|jgi:phospholipid/cholesterol/gamma-HCH transport system substrate-binding protein|nr:MCE family protein [Pseudonocardiaceae bacterium]
MSATSGALFKTRRRIIGVAFLVVLAMLIWLSIALYNKQFAPEVMVTLETSSTGNELHDHAEVKVRGVQVGEVRSVAADGASARIELAIDPDQVNWLPANVSAQLLPTTLFGPRYVDLSLPSTPDTQRLANGSIIGEDHSANAIELQTVLNNLMNLLEAIQPQKLSVTLTAVAQALDGRGVELGHTITNLNTLLQQLNPQLPAIDNDITQLVNVVNGYNNSAPQILQAFADFAQTSKTIVDEKDNLNALYTSLTGAADDLNSFFAQNGNNIIRLSADSRTTLQTLAQYSPEIPCVLRQLVAFEPEMDRVLGAGTGQPGLHVNLTVVPSLGHYGPGDSPVYDTDTGPHCPAGTSADVTANPANPSVSQLRDAGVGAPNSPMENELINELTAPGLGEAPSSLPGWSSLLLGPIYRGSEVTIK